MGALFSKFGNSSNGAAKAGAKTTKPNEGSKEPSGPQAVSEPAGTGQDEGAASVKSDVTKPEEKQDTSVTQEASTTPTTATATTTDEKQTTEISDVKEQMASVASAECTISQSKESAVQDFYVIKTECSGTPSDAQTEQETKVPSAEESNAPCEEKAAKVPVVAADKGSDIESKVNALSDELIRKEDEEIVVSDLLNVQDTSNLVEFDEVLNSDFVESEVKQETSAECFSQLAENQSIPVHEDVAQPEASVDLEEVSEKLPEEKSVENDIIISQETEEATSSAEASDKQFENQRLQDTSVTSEEAHVVSSDCVTEPTEQEPIIQDHSVVTPEASSVPEDFTKLAEKALADIIVSFEEQEKEKETLENGIANKEEDLIEIINASPTESPASHIATQAEEDITESATPYDNTEENNKPFDAFSGSDDVRDSTKEKEPQDNKEIILSEQTTIDADQSLAHDDMIEQSSPAQMLLPVVELAEQLSNNAITSAVREVTMMSAAVDSTAENNQQNESDDVEILSDAKNEQDASSQPTTVDDITILPGVENVPAELQSKTADFADQDLEIKPLDIMESRGATESRGKSKSSEEAKEGDELPLDTHNNKTHCEESDGDIEIIQDS